MENPMFHVFSFNLLRHRQTNLGPSIRVGQDLPRSWTWRWDWAWLDEQDGNERPGVTKLWRAKRMLGKARPRPVIFHGMKRGRILLARSRLSDSWQKLAWLDGWPPPPSLRDKSPTWREDSTLQVVTPEYLKPLYVKFFPLWRCETEVFTVLQL